MYPYFLGIKKCGGLLVVQTKDREISFRRLYDRVKYVSSFSYFQLFPE